MALSFVREIHMAEMMSETAAVLSCQSFLGGAIQSILTAAHQCRSMDKFYWELNGYVALDAEADRSIHSPFVQERVPLSGPLHAPSIWSPSMRGSRCRIPRGKELVNVFFRHV